MAAFKYVGLSPPCPDAFAKASGELRYATDLRLAGMSYACLLTSPHAHARIDSIDARRALQVSGVIGVYSHEDAPATRYCRYRIVPGQAGCVDDESLFAVTARFVGDRIAAVVATSPQAAREGVRRIEVGYTPLPAVLSAETALEPDAAHIHAGGNLLHRFDHATGDAPVAPADAVRTCTRVSTQMLHHAAIEPHTCLANFDASGRLTVWSPCQSVYGARTVVADLLGLAYNKVRIVKVPMGGSFGGKQEFILEPVTAYLAMRTGRPVCLTLDREACIRSTMVRAQQRSDVRSTVGADGLILDLEVDTLLAAGAYASSSPDYSEAMAHKLTRLYRVGRYHHRGRVAYTNTPVAGGMRGWGAPDIATCAEIHLDQVASRLGLDPLEIRLRNLVHPGDIDPLTGHSVGEAWVRRCLARGAEAFGWRERVGLPAGTGRIRRAVGLACGAHKNGIFSDAFPEATTMTLKMNEDGSLDLNASIHEVGAGSAVTLQTIIAEELDVAPQMISTREADSESTPYDFGCFGSRLTYFCGAAARALAAKMRARLIEAAAELLAVASENLCAAGGRVVPLGGGDSGLSYAQIVQAARMRYARDMIVTHTHRGTSNPGSYCVQFAEVEVDVLTGLVRVNEVLTVVDIGRAINRQMVEGQCRGAIQSGIGSALCEEVTIDGAGRTGAGGFKNYHLINAADMPPVRVLLVEHDGDEGPYGAKSVGEIAVVPTAATIVNAVNRALGTRLATLPLTPDRILAALGDRAPSGSREPACG
ncbi:MAG: molybdopterin-dependent oxidoreductase [Steroidobacteraceae bacterium]|nr:molybdopterin-dependent oxidoreductase [Steroidobacteraceae bacterium]